MTIQESAQQAAALGARITHDQNALLGAVQSLGESIATFAPVSEGLDELSGLFAQTGSMVQAEKASALSDEAHEIQNTVQAAAHAIEGAVREIDAAMTQIEDFVERIHALDSGAMG